MNARTRVFGTASYSQRRVHASFEYIVYTAGSNVQKIVANNDARQSVYTTPARPLSTECVVVAIWCDYILNNRFYVYFLILTLTNVGKTRVIVVAV